MSKVTKRIAAILGSTEPEARQFCLDVQGKFSGSPPNFRAIETCLKEKPDATVEEIVDAIARDPRRFRSKPRTKKWRGRLHLPSILPEPEHPGPLWHFGDKIRKPGRLALVDVEKCPHGVPKTSKCAICDPEGFKQQTGL
jgi:hypothetical protein